MAFADRYPLLTYFLLAYLFTWSIEVPMMLGARGVIEFHLPLAFEALAGFGPFLAAVIVLALTRGTAGIQELFKSLAKWNVPLRWWFFAVGAPFLVLLIALAVTGETAKLFSGDICRSLVSEGAMLELVLLGGLLRGFGEEPGWRGFALPFLRNRRGPLAATLLLFPVWLVWHLPAFLIRPEFQLAAWLGFSAGIFAAAVWCTLLYDATRSVLMIVLWHAFINICRGFAQAASQSAFLAFGQIVLLVGIAIVIYWLIRRPGPYPEAAQQQPL